MVNHIRTLLGNQSSSIDNAGLSGFAEHYIPPGFQPREIQGNALSRIISILFGASPDRDMINYRLYQYMKILHSTPLERYVFGSDSRVTYEGHQRLDILDPESYTPTLETKSNVEIQIRGVPSPPDFSGVMSNWFRLGFDGSTVVVSERDRTEMSFSYPDEVFPLGRTGWVASILGSGNVDAIISTRNRPQWDLGQIVPAVEFVLESGKHEIFGLENKEPMVTYLNLWESNMALPWRLGALLLAVASRIEESPVSTTTAGPLG